MFMEMYLVFGAFIIACAYFSYRNGHRQGVLDGMENTIAVLEQGEYIRTATDRSGQVQIFRVSDSQVKNET